jgi:amino acid adenylation domain-containing protein
MIDSSARPSGLSAKRRALLAALLKEQGVAVSRTEIVRQSRDTTMFPMSFAQQRLWFAEQLESGSPVYNHASAIRLTGRLNVAALEQSLQAIAGRHEILRTTFAAIDGNLLQVIAETSSISLPQVDLTGLPVAEREREARRLAVEEAHCSFDLMHGPLLRAVLLRLDTTEHILLLTIHHIITDAWSNSVLNRELAVLYEAFARGVASPLPELPIQYADFAVWQREWLQGAVRETQLAYWRQQLAGAPPLLELPCDRPRPAIQRYEGAYEPLVLSKPLSAALVALSQREGVTLFMTLLAAFKTLLFRYTRQADLLVGSPNAGRTRSETEGLIGFFVNMLVLRTSLSGDPTFREVLQRVRVVASGAYAHQDLPFEQLVEELKPERNLSYSPLFQVAFALRNVPESALQLSNLTITPIQFDAIVTSEFDLTLFMAEEADGLTGAFEYNPDLFDASTIIRMMKHFAVLLESIVADPAQPIATLPMLTAAEQQQLLIDWNMTHQPYPDQHCIHELFELQVTQRPHATALCFGSVCLTYAELNQRANQLAHSLQRQGVGPEVFVGICMERSLELIIGILGVFKAGGAYVPIDPQYPADRIAYMLEDAQVPVLLTQQHLVHTLPAIDALVICLDDDWPLIAQERADNVVSGVLAHNLAYMIYTSGSTGRPKGVLVQHQGLCNLTYSEIEVNQAQPESRVLQFSSISFDGSIDEICMALVCGATLCLAPAETPVGAALLELLREQAITITLLPPSAAASIAPEDLPVLRTVNVGGEACTAEIVARWAPGRRFVNAYGLTETTVCATVAYCEADERRPSIGRPVANMQVYLLDAQLQPVPIGVPAELYIGGVQLARGYRKRPDLTAERFIPHPFSSTPGARLYRTGDLARYLPDGALEYLGRSDQQVKIRGFRIELGEVEATLAQHPAVHEAVVLVREDVPPAGGHSEKRLVAYIVPQPGQAPTRHDLRGFMQTKVPGYMVPTAFVILDAFPLTPNGKIDARALPIPEHERAARDVEHVPPRTQTELHLTQIWEDLLPIRPNSVNENFFDLGGHSLLAVRLQTRIQQQFGHNLPLPTLLQHATIAQLAGLLGQPMLPQAWSPVVALQRQGTELPFFCVHGGDGSALSFIALARSAGTARPWYGIQAAGLEGEQAPCTSIPDMAARYITALREIQPDGPYLLGGWSLGGVIAFEMAQQLEDQGQKVALLALLDSRADLYFTPRQHPALDDTSILAAFLAEIGGAAGQIFLESLDDLAMLEPKARVEHLIEQARQHHILPVEVEETQIRQRLAVFQANLQALEQYTPRIGTQRLTVLRALEEQAVPHADPSLGWAGYTSGGVDGIEVPGTHYTMLAAPHVAVLADRLQSCLDSISVKVVGA